MSLTALRRLVYGFVLGGALAVTPLAAQGSLSEQVLRLLTRTNTWSGVNTYASTVGVKLESGAGLSSPTCTDRLENRGGNLYFSCVLVAPSSGVGTVTSVAISVPSALLTVTGSPVTSSGTFAITLGTRTANTLFAGPTSGGAATPTFRAVVDNDVPDTITIDGTNNVTWASVNKTGSSLANLTTRSAADLSSGTLPDARFPATLPAASGVNLTALNATNLASGAVPAARMPALTGDITTSAGAVATTLANSGVSAGSYGSGSLVPVFTVDAKGRITTITTAAATPGGTAGVTNGGTGLIVYAVGDLIQASATTTLSRLAAVATGNVLLSGGVGTGSGWGKVGLTTHVSGILPRANGGTGLDTSAATNGFLLIGNGSGLTLAALTGTADQVVVTNGAGSITLSTPQSINTTSTPQFARLGLGVGAGSTAVITTAGIFDVGLFDDGNSGAADTITWTAGMVHKSTLTANTTYTFNAPTASGTWFTLELIQDGTGSRLATWPGTVIWQGGAAPTLSTVAGSKDVCLFLWEGTNYLGHCYKGT